jgi:uncharacterized protein (TIRG00374 family)
MKIRWRDLLGIALSAVFLAAVFRSVDVHQVMTHLRHADPFYLLGASAMATLMFPLRARRWRTILDPVAPDLPFGQLWRATAAGMMVNNVFPARAGEFARAYALTRETKRVTFSAAFASIGVDRIFDSFVVLILLLGAMQFSSFPSNQEIGGRTIGTLVATGALFAAVALVAFYVVVLFPDRFIRLFEVVVGRIAPRYEGRAREAMTSFVSGLGALRQPRHFAAIMWWTTLHWLVCAVAFWLGFRAVGIDAPFSAAIVLQGLIAIGVALPSTPGFFGVFEYVATKTLPLYGVSPTLAASWAISYHIASYIPITLIGGYYFVRLGLHFRELQRPSDGRPEPARPEPPMAAAIRGLETSGGNSEEPERRETR